MARIWRTVVMLFRESAKELRFRNPEAHCAESMAQAIDGWLIGPLPLSDKRYHPSSPIGGGNVEVLFGVPHGNKLGARDDLRRHIGKFRSSVIDPITRPTWAICPKLL